MKIQTMSLHDLECIKPILIEQFDDFWNFNILEQNFNNINSIYFVAKSEEGDSFGEKNNEPDTILGFVGLLDTPIDIEYAGYYTYYMLSLVICQIVLFVHHLDFYLYHINLLLILGIKHP